jgi:transposase
MTEEKTWVGIDVSKEVLDIYVLPQGLTLQQPNSDVGVQSLIEQLHPLSPSLVVVESTGGLERALVSGLQAATIPVAIANPRKVKGFATALGKAKTDKLDAQVIAQFARAVQPQPQPVVAPQAQQLSDLVRRRQQLVEMQVAEKNRLSRASETVQLDIKAHIEESQKRVETLNAQIQTLAQQQRDWQRKEEILQSVKGIGKVTSALCLAELPEMGTLGRKTDRQAGRGRSYQPR